MSGHGNSGRRPNDDGYSGHQHATDSDPYYQEAYDYDEYSQDPHYGYQPGQTSHNKSGYYDESSVIIPNRQ